MSATADLERQLADALLRLGIEARRIRLQLIVMAAVVGYLVLRNRKKAVA